MKKIYFATSNPFKLKRAKEILDNFIEIEGIDLNIEEPQSLDQKYVASYKTNKAFNLINKPVFTEDLGLYIKKYNEFPGVLTAFVVKGLGLEGIKKLIKENEPAFYKSTIFYKDNNTEFCVDVIMDGYLTINNISKTFNSYKPFESMFIPLDFDKPIADLNEEDKKNLLYNVQHYKKFLEKIKELNKI